MAAWLQATLNELPEGTMWVVAALEGGALVRAASAGVAWGAWVN